MKHTLPACFIVLVLCFQHPLFAQWVKQNSPTTNRLLSVQFVSPTTGYISGEVGTILKTTDGGTSWNKLTIMGIPAAFDAVRFVNDTGYLIGRGPTLLRTTNGGTNWTPLSITMPNPELGFSIPFSGYLFDGKNGIICGAYPGPSSVSRAFIARTSNAGESWQVQPHDSISVFNSITFTDLMTGYVVGARPGSPSPVILKTTDGGETWFNQQHPFSTGWFASVFFVTPTTGYVGGVNSARFLITTNAGETWTKQTEEVSGAIDLSLFATSPGTVYATSDAGKIYRSDDSGKTWVTQYDNFSKTMYSIFFIDEQTGFAVGESGYILKTTNGGVTFANIPVAPVTEYRIAQNYPNPFNPSTTITYSIIESGNVTLTVYDYLGREVETIVNEYKDIGTYSINFNAVNLSSGIYFYKIHTGKFVAVKKMLLLK